MRAVKFVSSDAVEKEFAATLRRNVHEYFKQKKLSTKGNWALAVQTLMMLLLYILPFILLLTTSLNAWGAVLVAILMGIGMAGIGMCVMHDAVHGSFSNKPWVNKLAGSTMYLLGSNVLNWKIQHNVLHHAYTNVHDYDEDIDSKGPIRLSAFAPLKKIHRYQYIHAFFFYGLMTISKLVKDFSQLAGYNKAGLTGVHARNPKFQYFMMVLVKMLYLFVFIGLPIMLTAFRWWQVILGFFIMHWVSGCILSLVFQMAHVVEGAEQMKPDANGIIHREWAVHELRTTSDFARNNRFLNWYVGGLNFQIEHHLFPTICHIHYRKIAPIVEKTAKEFGFEYNLKPTFRAAFKSHVKRLKQLGAQVNA